MLESLLVLAALVSGQVESTPEAQVSLRARARQLRRAELRGAQKARVIVIGAGLAGLEAANTLLDLDFQDFILLEVRITTVRLCLHGQACADGDLLPQAGEASVIGGRANRVVACPDERGSDPFERAPLMLRRSDQLLVRMRQCSIA